jgi:hypothetical protein
MKLILSTLLVLAGIALHAQKNTVVDTLWVNGLCGMCEERIEKAMDTKGVITADYDHHTKLLALVYNSKKISEDKIHALLHAVGHDTERGKAPDDVYANMHGCCKYREPGSTGCSDGHKHTNEDHGDDEH